MIKSMIIEGVTRDEFLSLVDNMAELVKEIAELKKLTENNVRSEFTLAELSKIKGYSKVQLRRIIEQKHIPFKIEGKEIIVSKEHSGLIKSKAA